MSYNKNTLRHRVLSLIEETFGLDTKSILSRTPPYLPSETTFREVLGVDEQGHTILRKAVAGDTIKLQTLYEKSTGQLVYYNSSGVEIQISTDLGDVKYSTNHSVEPTGLGQICIDNGVFYFSVASGDGYAWTALPVLAHTHTLLTIATEGTPVNAVAASGTLTAGDIPTATKTVTIGSVTYTFVEALSTEPTVANEILIEVSASATLDNLIAAINAGAGIGTKYSTGTVVHPTVSAAAGDGDTITLTAKTKGVAGNSIATVTNDTNISYGDTTLKNGVNGTVGAKGDLYHDTSYIYVAIAANTATGTNWRRIDLGSAY